MIKPIRFTTNRFLVFILILIFSTFISVLVGIPLLRQLLGFLFLTFIPGILILSIIKPANLGLTEKVCLSLGLSISFVMFVGLIVNFIFFYFGDHRPLSTNNLLISFMSISIILVIIAYIRNKNKTFNFPKNNLSIREKTYLLISATFPLLSIFGMYIMNISDNNILLLLLLLIIPCYIILITIQNQHLSTSFYPAAIILVSISLVMLLGLRSNHIIGVDAHEEYYIFQHTLINGQWQIFMNSTLDSCLSISILPTIYQIFINLNEPEYLVKILYPALFSIVPLIVYIICKKYTSNYYAFLAACFYMCQSSFLGAAFDLRTSIAILFFGLSVMAIYHPDLTTMQKRLLFIIFAASCIVSHYSTTYIFLFILLSTFIVMQIIRLIRGKDRHLNGSKTTSDIRFEGYLIFGSVALFFVLLFSWYSLVTKSAFISLIAMFTNTFNELQQFFIVETRGGEVAEALGSDLGTSAIYQQINFVFSWLTIIFIIVGILSVIIMYTKPKLFSNFSIFQGEDKSLRVFDIEFLVLSVMIVAIMGLAIILPYIFSAYGMGRAYGQLTVVLSLFFVAGALFISRIIHVKWTYIVVLIVLLPYFMFTTGVMYQLFGVPGVIELNSKGYEYEQLFVHEQESDSAKWLGLHAMDDIRISTDSKARWLMSQGYIAPTQNNDIPATRYIYLSFQNIVNGISINGKFLSQFPKSVLEEQNKIYASNGSEIYVYNK